MATSEDVEPVNGGGWFRKHAATSGTLGGAGLGDVMEAFQPGRAHLVEEAERKRREIVQSPSDAPPYGEIDLDSGVVVLHVDQ